MYRIRLATGQEQTYRSIQELTAGVQRGEVTAEAEIHHQRTDRWLPIESHPHYRMALEGGTVTRTSRLKFTRPSSPAPAPSVLPTPTAQKPDAGDLEELNRLLVLLDPLPTPAQRADSDVPAAKSPPELKLVRPERAAPPDKDQEFGTMLRLEDLEPIPDAEPTTVEPGAPDVVRDAHVTIEEAATPAAPPSAADQVAGLKEQVAPSDLGLPVEIHLDEIPVPAEFTPLEPVAASAEVAEEPAETTAPFEPAAMPVPATVEPAPPPRAEPAFAPTFQEPEPPAFAINAAATTSRRRFRPMLYVGAAAILALALFAFTGGGEEPEQGVVTPASATPATVIPPASTTPDTTASAAPVSTVGFPVTPVAHTPTSGSGSSAADSATSPAVLPSAPTLDLSADGTERVDAAAAPSHAAAGSGLQLTQGYNAAYARLAADFSSQMDRSGLVRLFSQTQLTTADGVAGARRALDAAGTAVRQYHGREAAIEKAYADSARRMERNGATPADLRDWMAHSSLRESQEAAGEATRLIGQIDAVFALFQAQAGHYKMDGSTIHFDDANAAARYADLQGWINRRLEHWAGQPDSSVPITVQPLLGGIGLTRLPTPR
jgi:hypothetical protein